MIRFPGGQTLAEARALQAAGAFLVRLASWWTQTRELRKPTSKTTCRLRQIDTASAFRKRPTNCVALELRATPGKLILCTLSLQRRNDAMSGSIANNNNENTLQKVSFSLRSRPLAQASQPAQGWAQARRFRLRAPSNCRRAVASD